MIRQSKCHPRIWIVKHQALYRKMRRLCVPLYASFVLYILLLDYALEHAWIVSPIVIDVFMATVILFWLPVLLLSIRMAYAKAHWASPARRASLIAQLEAEKDVEALAAALAIEQYKWRLLQTGGFSSKASLALERLLQAMTASDFAKLSPSARSVLLEVLRRSRHETLLLTLLSLIEQSQGVWAMRAMQYLIYRSPFPKVRLAAKTCLKQLMACEQAQPQTLLRSSHPQAERKHLLHPLQGTMASSPLREAEPMELVRGCAQDVHSDMVSDR